VEWQQEKSKGNFLGTYMKYLWKYLEGISRRLKCYRASCCGIRKILIASDLAPRLVGSD
jgi:hypothetical protein